MRTVNQARIARALWWGRRATLGLLLVSLFSGCASLPTGESLVPSQRDLAWVLSGADQTAHDDRLPTETVDSLLHVTPEMHQFALDAAGAAATPTRRTDRLVAALMSPKGLNLQYDAQATLTAQQAFEQRRVNCLSFALLFTALAHELGIPSQLNEVDIPPVWDIGDDQTVILYKHVNVLVDGNFPLYHIVDISGEEYDPTYPQHFISDTVALAEFDNNRAEEIRLKHDFKTALLYELRAVRLAPKVDYLWANLADLYAINGNLRAARIAIDQAIALDPSSMMDYNVATGIYQKLGDDRMARYFADCAHEFLEKNPYYHYQLAIRALRSSDIRTADAEIQRSISMQPLEHRFYFLAAVIREQRGDLRTANVYLQDALDLTTDSKQQLRYQNKFALLAHAHG